jgi:hypothetical protein
VQKQLDVFLLSSRIGNGLPTKPGSEFGSTDLKINPDPNRILLTITPRRKHPAVQKLLDFFLF